MTTPDTFSWQIIDGRMLIKTKFKVKMQKISLSIRGQEGFLEDCLHVSENITFIYIYKGDITVKVNLL